MRTLVTICVALALAGCGGATTPGGNTTAEAAPPVATPSNAASPAPTPAETPTPTAAARASRTDTDDYSFDYAVPASAAAIPALAAWLEEDRERVEAKVAQDSAAFRRERAADGAPFRKYESTTDWRVVTNTPRLLSIAAETYDYIGGAHGSPGFRSLVWDKQAGERLAATDLFTSPAALQSAAGAAFCTALDAARAKRRGVPVKRDATSFNACPKVAETVVILGSTNRRAIDRIGLLVPPYVAGPYAEGSYDLTLPVTPALLSAVKPDYRNTFALGRR
jgi:hypothetical protein